MSGVSGFTYRAAGLFFLVVLVLTLGILPVLSPSRTAVAAQDVFSLSDSINVSNSPDDIRTTNSQIIVSGDTIFLLWTESQPNSNVVNVMFAKSTDGGNSFGTPLTIGIGSQPMMALKGSNLFITWSDLSSDRDIYLIKSADAGETFGKPTNLTNNFLKSSGNPIVALDGSNVYVLWTQGGGLNPAIYLRVSTDNGATFRNSIKINKDDFDSNGGHIAASANNVYVTYGNRTYPSTDAMFAVSHDGGLSFSTPIKLSQSGFSQFPVIAADGNNVYAAFPDVSSFGTKLSFRASHDAGKTFGSQIDLSGLLGEADLPTIELLDNNIYVGWGGSFYNGGDAYFARSVDSGNTFSSDFTLSNGKEYSSPPHIAADGDVVFAVWDETNLSPLSYISVEASSNHGAGFSKLVDAAGSGSASGSQIAASGNKLFLSYVDRIEGFPELYFRTVTFAPVHLPKMTDFNGDGYEDLAVGVPGEDVGSTNPMQDAGAVNVIYGSSSGLSATAAQADQIWTQNSAGVDEQSEAGDFFGSSLASGDFNGDGYTDLAISAYGEDVGSTNPVVDAGAVNVIYGSPQGLNAMPAFGSPGRADQFWSQATANVEGTSEEGDLFGFSLAVGDFNNDDYDDLAIGVPYEDVGAAEDAGSVNILYGSSDGLSATLVLPDQAFTQDSPNIADSVEAGEGFGYSLTSGDFNQDSLDDLAIGVPGENIGSDPDGIDAGAVNVIYGSPSGLSATYFPDQIFSQDSTGIAGKAQGGTSFGLPDEFGYALAAGDFNNDGIDDLAIGVPGNQETGLETGDDMGAVNVIYGSSASGLSASGAGVSNQLWYQNAVNINGNGVALEYFGAALSAGDFNGDGFTDLAVGVPGDTLDKVSMWNFGAVNVIYGSGIGLSATKGTTGLADQLWSQSSAGIIEAAEGSSDPSSGGDRFGSALMAGDYNGDGFSDLAIGVPGETIGTVQIQNAGAVNVIYGSQSLGLSATFVPNQFFSQNSPNVDDSAEQDDFFGNLLVNSRS